MKRNYFWNPGYWNVQDKGIGSLALHVEKLKAGTWLSSSCILLQWRNRLLSPYSDTNPDTSPAPNLQPSHHQQPYPFHVRDLSFYTWMTSHDLVHSTVTLVSSLRDPASLPCCSSMSLWEPHWNLSENKTKTCMISPMKHQCLQQPSHFLTHMHIY